jgi:hypothetical protein
MNKRNSPDVLPPSRAPTPAAATPPRASTIDDLIARLADIKAKKAALDRAEKETITLLKEKLKQQKERLKKLGVPAEDNSSPTPVPTAPVLPSLS